jgi:hypothetical protein
MEVHDQVWRLLLDKVDSFEKLEVLMLLSAKPREWTVRAATEELRLPEPLVETAMLDLCAVSLLEKEGQAFRYQPATPELAREAEALTRMYVEDRIRVLNVLSSAAFDRIRSSAATAFANAFKLRGKPKE